LDKFFKFNLGQEVRPKGSAGDDKIKVVVLERLLQQCDGGVQIAYLLRPFFYRQRGLGLSLDTGATWEGATTEMRMREMELEEIT